MEMNREQALEYLAESGYRVEHLQGTVWKIWQNSTVVGRGAGDDMLIMFAKLLKFQTQREAQPAENS